MKLALGVSDLTEPTLRFAAQYGVTHLKVDAALFLGEDQRGVVDEKRLANAVRRTGDHGLKIGVILLPQGRETQHWNIRLGTPARESEIEDVCRTIETVGGHGIPVVEYVFNLLGNRRPDAEPRGRGGAVVAWFDGEWADGLPKEDALAAEPDEIWDRISWFLERAVPAAEKAGVRLGCHHDDPPVPRIGGETRVLCSIEGMKRLVETVPSDSNGLTLCLGTVAEMGEDVPEVIRWFGSRKKINHVHFRNVKGSLPHFEESFLDDGDTDMLAAMKAFGEIGYEGTLIPDHVPGSDEDRFCRGSAFALGYMKALMKAAGT